MVHVMACCLCGTKPPKPMLTCCWLEIWNRPQNHFLNENICSLGYCICWIVCWHWSRQWLATEEENLFHSRNTYENVVYRMVANLFRLQCVNSLWPSNVIWWHRSWSTVAAAMACCHQAPSHYLNQCWLLISEDLWHSPERPVPQQVPQVLFWRMSLNILLLKLLPHLPGTNQYLTGIKYWVTKSTGCQFHCKLI